MLKYLLCTVVWVAVLEYLSTRDKYVPSWTLRERVIQLIIAPISFIVFVRHLIVTTFSNREF